MEESLQDEGERHVTVEAVTSGNSSPALPPVAAMEARGSPGFLSLPLRLRWAELSPPERHHSGPVASVDVAGGRLITGGHDGRVLVHHGVPKGPLRFAPPELLPDGGPVVDLVATRIKETSRLVVIAAIGKAPPMPDEPAGDHDCSEIRLWEVDHRSGGNPDLSQSRPRLLRGHSAAVRGVDITRGGSAPLFVMSASEDATARLWDVRTGSEVLALGHTRTVTKAKFFPSSTLVATMCRDNMVRVWDLRASTAKPTFLIQVPLPPAATRQTTRGVCFDVTREGEMVLASGGNGGGQVELFDIPRAAASQGEMVLASGGNGGGQVELFDIPRSGARRVALVRMPESFRPTAVQFAMQDSRLVFGTFSGDVCVAKVDDLTSRRFDMQAFSVQHKEDKQEIVSLRCAPMGFGQALVAYTFGKCGFGFGLIGQKPAGIVSGDVPMDAPLRPSRAPAPPPPPPQTGDSREA